jgi:hypothetical protein
MKASFFLNYLFLIPIFILGFLSSTSYAQEEKKLCPKMLLSDIEIQIESTDAVNQMYNFKFDKAASKYTELRNRYPEHPLPYFLLGLNNWWKMLPNTDNHSYDKPFLAYMDSTIAKAEILYKENKNNLEAAFFLAASYGLLGEFHGNKKSYTKSAMATKNAISYFKVTSDNSDLNPEFLYGKAVMNYYRTWLREEYPLLTPILVFFPSGDKELGIRQLKEVTYNSFYSRTEAQYQLLRIYDNEDEYHKGYPIAQYLASIYPDNAYFLRQYAKFAWFVNKLDEAKKTCKSIIHKLDSGMPGFEENSGRYAGYILGDIYKKQGQIDSAKTYFLKAVEYSERAGHTEQGYYLYAIDGLAQIAEDQQDYDLALEYYKKLKKNGRKKKKSYTIVKDSKGKIKEIKEKN